MALPVGNQNLVAKELEELTNIISVFAKKLEENTKENQELKAQLKEQSKQIDNLSSSLKTQKETIDTIDFKPIYRPQIDINSQVMNYIKTSVSELSKEKKFLGLTKKDFYYSIAIITLIVGFGFSFKYNYSSSRVIKSQTKYIMEMQEDLYGIYSQNKTFWYSKANYRTYISDFQGIQTKIDKDLKTFNSLTKEEKEGTLLQRTKEEKDRIEKENKANE